MLEKGKVIILSDDNEYSIVDMYTIDNTTYIYLVDINNNLNIIYGKLKNDEIVELTDPDELESMIEKVNQNLHNN